MLTTTTLDALVETYEGQLAQASKLSTQAPEPTEKWLNWGRYPMWCHVLAGLEILIKTNPTEQEIRRQLTREIETLRNLLEKLNNRVGDDHLSERQFWRIMGKIDAALTAKEKFEDLLSQED